MTRVLIVDDTEATRYANDRILRGAGFEVLQAETGAQALALAPRADVVLLDIKLPDVSGIEVCRALKRDQATAALPVLHLTATYGLPAKQVDALNSGADAYLTYPVEPIVLVATVRALLRARSAEIEARRLSSFWQSTFDSIGEGLALLDHEGLILRCNLAMAALLGCSPAEALGRSGVPVLPGAIEPADGWPLWRALETRARAVSVFNVGEEWYEVVADPVMDAQGEVATVVRTVKDITRHKQDEARLADLLQREQAARQDAENVARVKDEFLATVSHEVRTPLHAIVGWIHLLRSGALDADGTARALETVARNAQIQSQLISDILDVSRIVAGKLHLELKVVDLADVVRAALQTVRPAASAKGIAFVSELDPAASAFMGDPDRLQQVVWNLLANAIKFTPVDGRVRVQLEALASGVKLTVEDNGPGIEPAFLPFAFDRFRQGDASTTRPHGGLGLGLAIVRHLVELHGGTVSVRNRAQGTGAVFEILLPRSTAGVVEPARRGPGADAEREAEYGLVATPRLTGTTVLLVDDDADSRTLLAFVLERAGASVVSESSAAAGLRALIEGRPDVLLADVEMPGEDGYSLIAKVRALPFDEGGATPAAAITAYASAQDRVRALQAGFQLHVPKPVQPTELVTIVSVLKGMALRRNA